MRGGMNSSGAVMNGSDVNSNENMILKITGDLNIKSQDDETKLKYQNTKQ